MFNFWAMCIVCKHKWIATAHVSVSIFKLECPKCTCCDSFASLIADEYIQAMRETFPEADHE